LPSTGNPKFEIRNPKEIRSPKPERACNRRRSQGTTPIPLLNRLSVSDFGLLSVFGDSGFEVRVQPLGFNTAGSISRVQRSCSPMGINPRWTFRQAFSRIERQPGLVCVSR